MLDASRVALDASGVELDVSGGTDAWGVDEAEVSIPEPRRAEQPARTSVAKAVAARTFKANRGDIKGPSYRG